MKRTTKGHIIYYTGLAVSILAPLVAAATQFPVWTEKVPGTQIGGMFIFVSLLCLIPLFNHLKIALKSPSSCLLWTLVFVCTWALSKIIDELLIVALVGAIANYAGALLCGIGNYLRRGRFFVNAEISDRDGE